MEPLPRAVPNSYSESSVLCFLNDISFELLPSSTPAKMYPYARRMQFWKVQLGEFLENII